MCVRKQQTWLNVITWAIIEDILIFSSKKMSLSAQKWWVFFLHGLFHSIFQGKRAVYFRWMNLFVILFGKWTDERIIKTMQMILDPINGLFQAIIRNSICKYFVIYNEQINVTHEASALLTRSLICKKSCLCWIDTDWAI